MDIFEQKRRIITTAIVAVVLTGISIAVVVSTPQDIALMDARKGIDMFRQMNVPLLGMIENMSTHICSNCGHEEHVFGHGGVAAEAEKLGVPLLAEVPLHLNIRLAGDGGRWRRRRSKRGPPFLRLCVCGERRSEERRRDEMA